MPFPKHQRKKILKAAEALEIADETLTVRRGAFDALRQAQCDLGADIRNAEGRLREAEREAQDATWELHRVVTGA